MYINSLAGASWRRISTIYHTSCINNIPELSRQRGGVHIDLFDNVFQNTTTNEHHLDKDKNLKGLSKLQETNLTNNMQKFNH